MSGSEEQSDDREQQLDAIIAEYYCSTEKGEVPDQGHFIARYPDFQQELSDFFADLDMFQHSGHPLEERPLFQLILNRMEKKMGFGEEMNDPLELSQTKLLVARDVNVALDQRPYEPPDLLPSVLRLAVLTPMERRDRRLKQCRLMASALGLTVILLALISLVGWAVGNERMKSVIPGKAAMNPGGTAISLILVGTSIWLLREPALDRRRFAGYAIALGIILIGSFRLYGYLFHWDEGPDGWLFPRELETYSISNRMPPNEAFVLIFIGLALCLINIQVKRLRPTEFLASVSALIALLALIGYLHGAFALIGVRHYIPMALNSAFAVFVSSLGIFLARPDRGLMRLVTSECVEGQVQRILIPASLIVPLSFGWLISHALRNNYVDQGTGISILGTAVVVTFLALVLFSAHLSSISNSYGADSYSVMGDATSWLREPSPASESSLGSEVDTKEKVDGNSSPPAVKHFASYELLSEISRGGMGVVFRARDARLNRMVAVKMILAGQLASPKDVQRFRFEAEVVASLDHPNIIPIYEVGEHEGQHFFSMKLIEGGSLARYIPLQARDMRVTARLIALLAQSIQFVHQHGIIHRDLKPANILIDESGVPYITDFGLAKSLDGNVDLTQSGAILGTPSYMSPEQAFGRRELVTTASDIYGLGAILYALLTGVPPFHSGSLADVIRKLTEEPPTPPRDIRPDIEGDLESICLMCLRKDPNARYQSADLLAQDLDRWLRGATVRASPR